MTDKLQQVNDTFKKVAAQNGMSENDVNSFLENPPISPELLNKLEQLKGATPSAASVGAPENSSSSAEPFYGSSMGKMLGDNFSINTPFGAKSSADVFSNGINYGPDLGVKEGTRVATPPTGKWKVLESFGGAKEGTGYIGNNTNRGYGNSVLVQNMLTGEMLRYSHLSQVGVTPGQVIDGGTAFGTTGLTGNTSGSHLDLEMYDATGKITDPLKSSYAKYL